MIYKKKEDCRNQIELSSTEALMPKEHLLRKIEAAIDFTKIYDIVRDLYCPNNGRPSIDPVVLIKIVMIQHLYGIRSMRQTISDIEMNIAYRWFLGFGLSEPIPHFATVSYNFRHRFTTETTEEIFEWILKEIETAGYLQPEAVFLDGTHIKANANMKKRIVNEIPKAARIYEKQLREEINSDRERHGKKPFDDDPPEDTPKTKSVIVSTTDPESGVFHKGEHKKCFAYAAQVVCEKNGYVLCADINPGNMHDSVAFDRIYDKLTKRFPKVETIVADAGYKTPWICKRIFDDGRVPSLPYKRPMTKKGNLEWYKYVYDEYYDQVICPEYKLLDYSTTDKEGYREYKSDPKLCKECSVLNRCTLSKKFQKTIAIHIWKDYIERAEDVRHSEHGKETYALRSQTIERIFADAKEKHGMRYTLIRGIKYVGNWITLKFAAMNLKKYALRKWKTSLFSFMISSLKILDKLVFKNPIIWQVNYGVL